METASSIPTFGGSGFVTTNLGIADEAAAVAIQPDGKIVVAGRTDQDTVNFGLVRYNPDGTLDRTFTFDGISTVDFNGRNDLASSVALQADGKIVVAGRTAGQDGLNSCGGKTKHGRHDRYDLCG
jgi:uncharacterized delta-60 repeat protein